MNHRVKNVTELYGDAHSLYDDVVLGKADTIINNLQVGIDILKQNWKGMDAGVQIQDVVVVHNAFVELRNALAELARDSSDVAIDYREIQIINRANADSLNRITITTKSVMEGYVDNSDTININPEASNGKQKLDAANGMINDFVAQVRTYYAKIMDNWTQGPGRNNADGAFTDFISKSNSYVETLNSVSSSISSALSNYSF